MITNKTVVISCAGMGKRLGMNMPKCLIEIGGKTLMLRTLEQLNDVKDVRIVVGYQAERVMEEVRKYRQDITFVFNHNYMNNGTGASVSLAIPGASEYILTIDGDITVHPEDMVRLINLDYECIAGGELNSDDPVKLSVDDLGNVVGFSREMGQYEWTGVCCIKAKNLQPTDGHVYYMLEPILPKKLIIIRYKEVDTPDDLKRAEKWLMNNYQE